MRIALLGPFSGSSLASAFPFLEAGEVLPPGYPGAQHMAVLAKALLERGHEVATISTDYYTPIADLEPFRAFRGEGIHVYFCPQRPHSFRSACGKRGRALDFFRYERNCLQAAIADFAPEIIHAHWTYEFAWAALDSGVPTLTTAHDSPLKVLRFMPSMYRLFRYFMARRVLAHCQQVTAVSPDLKRELCTLTPAPIHVVANPISGPILQERGCVPQAMQSRTLVMALNGWNHLKNGGTALHAFSLAKRIEPELRLVCFGAGFESGGEAHRWAVDKGFTANVEFRGAAPHALLLEQMRASMALLHPSRNEACSMAIAEAMSVGLPVIAGRATSGVAWQLDRGQAGVLTDINNAQAIADAIVALCGNHARWQEISTTARSRARQLFALDTVVDAYVSLYTEAKRHWHGSTHSPPAVRPEPRAYKRHNRCGSSTHSRCVARPLGGDVSSHYPLEKNTPCK